MYFLIRVLLLVLLMEYIEIIMYYVLQIVW